MLVHHHEFLCAHQRSVDRESAINDYAIREEALKSNTFQFRNHKPSEMVTNCKCLWSNWSPLNWGQDDSNSVSNSFYVAALVAHSFWQAAAYLIWYAQSETFQVLIKMRAEWPYSGVVLEFMTVRVETVLSQRDWYLWTKRLSRSICQHVSLSFLCSFLPVSQHLDTFGMERRRGGEETLFHPPPPPSHCSPGGSGVGLWSCVSHDRDTSNPVRH